MKRDYRITFCLNKDEYLQLIESFRENQEFGSVSNFLRFCIFKSLQGEKK